MKHDEYCISSYLQNLISTHSNRWPPSFHKSLCLTVPLSTKLKPFKGIKLWVFFGEKENPPASSL